MHPFEAILSVSKEEIELESRAVTEVAWSDFWLNPRKLRGSDFLMRWSQGVWSEKRLTDAINATNHEEGKKTSIFANRMARTRKTAK